MDDQDPIVSATPDKIAGWVVVRNEWRLANTQAGCWKNKEVRRSFGPIGSSPTIARDRHFLTVFSLIPNRLASSADEACDRCSSARTACVVLALP